MIGAESLGGGYLGLIRGDNEHGGAVGADLVPGRGDASMVESHTDDGVGALLLGGLNHVRYSLLADLLQQSNQLWVEFSVEGFDALNERVERPSGDSDNFTDHGANLESGDCIRRDH
jgi:hypothetical protein